MIHQTLLLVIHHNRPVTEKHFPVKYLMTHVYEAFSFFIVVVVVFTTASHSYIDCQELDAHIRQIYIHPCICG